MKHLGSESPLIPHVMSLSTPLSLLRPLLWLRFAFSTSKPTSSCVIYGWAARGDALYGRGAAPVNEPTHARARETGARRRHTYAIGQRRRGRLAPPRTCRAGLISRRAAVLLPKLLLGLIPRRVGVSTSRTRR
jgi:hypothetical protein